MVAVVTLKDVREDAGERALKCADADRSGLAACEIDEILPGDRDSVSQLVDVTGEDRTCLCERRLRATRGALEQALPDDLLECCDLLADGRLGVAEHLSGTCKRARLGDRRERGKMPQVEAGPKIAQHDESWRNALSVESYAGQDVIRTSTGRVRRDLDERLDVAR